MKISIKTAGLALLLTACSNAGTEGPATQEKILPYSIYQHRLDNGLNVVTVPFDSPGLAAFHIVTRVGAMNDVEPGVTGFAHFFEHMMFRGTDKYPKEKYRDALKSTGAAANADTELEVTADGTNISVKQTKQRHIARGKAVFLRAETVAVGDSTACVLHTSTPSITKSSPYGLSPQELIVYVVSPFGTISTTI